MELELRKWTMGEKKWLKDICNYGSRAYTSNRLPFPYSDEDAKGWITKAMDGEGKTGIYRAIVVDGQYIGFITVEQKGDVCCKDSEIGYMLLTPYWSKGIGTEAVRQICGIAFDELDILRITAMVYEENIASNRVLEKNGFKLEGVMKKALYKEGVIHNQSIYGLLKE